MMNNKGCWGRWCARLCIKNRLYRLLLKSQLNLMQRLQVADITPEEAMQREAVIEKVLKGE